MHRFVLATCIASSAGSRKGHRAGAITRGRVPMLCVFNAADMLLFDVCFSEHRATIEYGAPALTIDHRPSAKPFVQLDVELVVGGNQCDVLCQVWW